MSRPYYELAQREAQQKGEDRKKSMKTFPEKGKARPTVEDVFAISDDDDDDVVPASTDRDERKIHSTNKAAKPQTQNNQEDLGDLLSQLASYTKDYDAQQQQDRAAANAETERQATEAKARAQAQAQAAQQEKAAVAAAAIKAKQAEIAKPTAQVLPVVPQFDPSQPPPPQSQSHNPSQSQLSSVLSSLGITGDEAKAVMSKLLSQQQQEQQSTSQSTHHQSPIVASVTPTKSVAQPQPEAPPVVTSVVYSQSPYQQQQMYYTQVDAHGNQIMYAQQPSQPPVMMAPQVQPQPAPAATYYQPPTVAVNQPTSQYQQPLPPGAELSPHANPYKEMQQARPPPRPDANKEKWLHATKQFEEQLNTRTSVNDSSSSSSKRRAESLEKQLCDLRRQQQSFGETSNKLRNELDRLKRQHADLQRRAARSSESYVNQSLLNDNLRLQREIEEQLGGKEQSLKQLEEIVQRYERQLDLLKRSGDDTQKQSPTRRSASKSKSSKHKSKKKKRDRSGGSSSSDEAGSDDQAGSKKKKKRKKVDDEAVVTAKQPEQQQPQQQQQQQQLERIVYFDPGSHWCRVCNTSYNSVADLFQHLHSDEHIQRNDKSKRPWMTTEVRQELQAQQDAAANSMISGNFAQMMPIQGSEFVVPVRGYYCMLCEQFSGDDDHAQVHIKTRLHRNRYMELLSRTPTYERDYNSAKMASLLKQSSGASNTRALVSTTDHYADDLRLVVNGGNDQRRVQRSAEDDKLQIKVTQSVEADAKKSSGDSHKHEKSSKSEQHKTSSSRHHDKSSSGSRDPRRSSKSHDNKEDKSSSSSKTKGSTNASSSSRHHQSSNTKSNQQRPPSSQAEHESRRDTYRDNKNKSSHHFTSAPTVAPVQHRLGPQPVNREPSSVEIAQAIERRLQGKAAPEDMLVLNQSGASGAAQVKMSVVQVHLPHQASIMTSAGAKPIDTRLAYFQRGNR